ncbi:unnamed protein product [Anisakis simplex]|uniref:Uncharacterized protein n=1 Tax=Anisakis simplex TaxID=6269 RepID=A0A0M3KGG1_ANISI|nr:unnamed protein product [Anisakis simplex]
MSTSDSLTTSSVDEHEMHDYVFRIAPISVPTLDNMQKTYNVDEMVLDEITTPLESPKKTSET